MPEKGRNAPAEVVRRSAPLPFPCLLQIAPPHGLWLNVSVQTSVVISAKGGGREAGTEPGAEVGAGPWGASLGARQWQEPWGKKASPFTQKTHCCPSTSLGQDRTEGPWQVSHRHHASLTQ